MHPLGLQLEADWPPAGKSRPYIRGEFTASSISEQGTRSEGDHLKKPAKRSYFQTSHESYEILGTRRDDRLNQDANIRA